jgi:hypothetical protein
MFLDGECDHNGKMLYKIAESRKSQIVPFQEENSEMAAKFREESRRARLEMFDARMRRERGEELLEGRVDVKRRRRPSRRPLLTYREDRATRHAWRWNSQRL